MKRCAIYTRKSTEEGLEQEFNSLHAQREACEAYIKSQKHEGWKAVRHPFDDGGYSGGSTDRPALAQLLAAVERREIDVVVVYKVDRLTRSLADFVKIVELFDRFDVSFISVTQQFNTTSSMGRLTLNVLLSFAQFEREVTSERIRDKIAASKRKGMWMGGPVPIGYDARDKRLVVNANEASTVERLFQSYMILGSVRALQGEANRLGLVTKRRVHKDGSTGGAKPFSRGNLYKLLSNPLYAGMVRHGEEVHPGLHEAIIDAEVWQRVQAMLKTNATERRHGANAKAPSLLSGIVYDETGDRLCPTHAVKGERRYRYYISKRLVHSADRVDGWRLPAQELERIVSDALFGFFSDSRRLMAILPGGSSAAQVAATIKSGAVLADQLQMQEPASNKALIAEIVQWIDVTASAMRITLFGDSVGERLGIATGKNDASTSPISIDVPVALRRRGVETKLVLRGDTGNSPEPDPHLRSLIARGHVWFQEVASGMPISAIATRNQKDPSDVGKILRFAFLAPDIVEAILDGRQPAEITARSLRAVSQIPTCWQQQRIALGFSPA